MCSGASRRRHSSTVAAVAASTSEESARVSALLKDRGARHCRSPVDTGAAGPAGRSRSAEGNWVGLRQRVARSSRGARRAARATKAAPGGRAPGCRRGGGGMRAESSGAEGRWARAAAARGGGHARYKPHHGRRAHVATSGVSRSRRAGPSSRRAPGRQAAAKAGSDRLRPGAAKTGDQPVANGLDASGRSPAPPGWENEGAEERGGATAGGPGGSRASSEPALHRRRRLKGANGRPGAGTPDVVPQALAAEVGLFA